MKRYIFAIILSMLFYFASALSQPTIEVLAGMHYPVGFPKVSGINTFEDYWKPSLNFGVRANIQLTKSINFSPSMFYNHYLYHGYYYDGPHFEEVFVASSGESSDVFRIMVELQLIAHSANLVRPYFEIGSGYVVEKQGIIHGKMEYLGRFEYSKDIDGLNVNYFVYNIGVGGIVSLSNDFCLDVSAKYHSNTTDRFYLLYNLSIAYKIFN
jgi:hypothetical protein